MGKARKRAGLPVPVRKPPWFWPVTVSGWVAAALVWSLDLPSKVNSFYEQKDKAWTHVAPERINPLTYVGRWTNDLDLAPGENLITDGSPQKDKGSLQLQLDREKDGSFSGELVSEQLGRSIVPWSRVSVTGEVNGLSGFRGEAWDIVGGHHRTIAYFTLVPTQVRGTKGIRFTSDTKFARFLPSDTVLWETGAAMSTGVAGKEFEKALMDTAKSHEGLGRRP